MFGKKDKGKQDAKVYERSEDIYLKYEKLKLHIKYIIGIGIMVIIAMIVNYVIDNELFVGKLELTSTITSIILSIIAIFMSISEEGKTEEIRNQMVEATMELRNTLKAVNEINDIVNESIKGMQNNIDLLQQKIDTIPDRVDEIYRKNKNSRIENINEVDEVGSNQEWGEKTK